jgi:hypothetical protein
MPTSDKTSRRSARRAIAVVALLVAGVAGWRAFRSATVGGEGRAAVRTYLVTEAQHGVLDSADATLKKVTAGDIAAGLAAGQALLRAHQISVRSLGAHGFGDTLHVRVGYAAGNDAALHVTYLRIAYSLPGGWQVVGHSSALAYYTRL